MNTPRKRAFAAYSIECSECRSTDRLEVHHIDENHQNHEVSNLRIMCRDCHMALHDIKRELKVVRGYESYLEENPDGRYAKDMRVFLELREIVAMLREQALAKQGKERAA